MSLTAGNGITTHAVVPWACPSWLRLNGLNPNLRHCKTTSPGKVVDYRVQLIVPRSNALNDARPHRLATSIRGYKGMSEEPTRG
jgi:hypothetical protein